MFAEWALWGADDTGFVHRFFNWIRSHGRVRMQLYNQGGRPAARSGSSTTPARAS